MSPYQHRRWFPQYNYLAIIMQSLGNQTHIQSPWPVNRQSKKFIEYCNHTMVLQKTEMVSALENILNLCANNKNISDFWMAFI